MMTPQGPVSAALQSPCGSSHRQWLHWHSGGCRHGEQSSDCNTNTVGVRDNREGHPFNICFYSLTVRNIINKYFKHPLNIQIMSSNTMCTFVFPVCVYTFFPQCSTVCAAFCQEHTPSSICGVSFRCPFGPWTLTQCPVCELAISLQALTAGGWPYRCLLGQTAAPFPRPALQQWSLVQHPPLLNVSTDVTLLLTSQALCLCVCFLFYPPVCSLALFPPEDWSVYLWHICTSPLFMFPSVSAFCKMVGRL